MPIAIGAPSSDLDSNPYPVREGEAADRFSAGAVPPARLGVAHVLETLKLRARPIDAADVADELGRPARHLVLRWAIAEARKQDKHVLFVQLGVLAGGESCLHANAEHGLPVSVPLRSQDDAGVQAALSALRRQFDKPLAVFPHGELVGRMRALGSVPDIALCPQAYQPVLDCPDALLNRSHGTRSSSDTLSPHLRQLEAESIHILREAVADARNPAMLYSIGKDSAVMLHLARKAFFPGTPPFPLLHVDTRWKFQEMYLFRDFMAKRSGMELIVHVNPQAIERDINPFVHGSALHTDITKTEGLKQALDQHRFDVVFGGARRDEERSRAKERVFSLRSETHRWDPRNQRPEPWDLYNTRKRQGESLRVFPLSNWTELDVWQYILNQRIPVVPLYFAQPRPVVVRPDMIMMVDDDRCRLQDGERIELRTVRFRTLGCYPLSGAIESNAQTVEDILVELIHARQSERQGRVIDHDGAGSMERKKQEGYF